MRAADAADPAEADRTVCAPHEGDPRGSPLLWLNYSSLAAPIVIYTRRECGLCEEAKDAIAPIARKRGLAIELVDVDRDPELVKLYGEEVPVVFVNGRKAFKYHVDTTKLESLLERGA